MEIKINQIELLKQAYRCLLDVKNINGSDAFIAAMFPSIGNEFVQHQELLVVGRASNGWGTEKDKIWWNKNKPLDGEIIENIIKYSCGEHGKCALQWIMDSWDEKTDDIRRMNTSAFWRVVKSVVEKIPSNSSTNSENWASRIAWTELYKISYANGGNPDSPLCDIQYQWANLCLQLEIFVLKPKRILFLTGYGWARDFIQVPPQWVMNGNPVEWSGAWNGIPTVLAQHPQGKEQESVVNAILKGFDMGNSSIR